jgi:hypothetical protein
MQVQVQELFSCVIIDLGCEFTNRQVYGYIL